MKIRMMTISSMTMIVFHDTSNVDIGINDHFIHSLDIYDHKNWGILDAKTKDIWVEKLAYLRIEYHISYKHTF